MAWCKQRGYVVAGIHNIKDVTKHLAGIYLWAGAPADRTPTGTCAHGHKQIVHQAGVLFLFIRQRSPLTIYGMAVIGILTIQSVSWACATVPRTPQGW